MKILCLYPSLISGWSSYVRHGNNESSFSDHSLMMLSAVLKRAGHECFSMDLRSFASWEHFETILKKQTFDLTLVTFYSANEIFARKAVEIVKRNFPNKYIIGGGVHLSVTKTREYPNIDSIVWGEGEPHILNIVDTISRGNAPEKLYELKMIEDMDSLPYVDRDLFNREMEETSPLVPGLPEPFITIVAGRGCPHACLTGDTIIHTSKGDFEIKDLVGREDIMVLTRNPVTQEPVYVLPKYISKTRENTNIVRVRFDDGSHIDCTPDHKFKVFKSKNQYIQESEWDVEAKDLKPKQQVRAIRFENNNLGRVYISTRRDIVRIRARVLMESILGRKLYPDELIHHIDGSKDNDVSTNLILTNKKDHMSIYHHAEIAERMRKNNPVKNMTPEWREKLRKANIGKKRSLGTRIKLRESKLGVKNPNYKLFPKHRRKYTTRIAEVNHKVVTVECLAYKADVFCMEIPEIHWFYANKVLVHNCSFCAPSRELINGKKCRIRSVDHFLGEIIQINKQKPIGSLMIHDDLLGTKKWMDEFIQKWHANNLPRIPFWCQLRADTVLRIRDYIPALSEIGLQFTSIGLEGGSQRMLDFMHKDTTVEQNIEACQLLHDNNINVFGNFISGYPTETEEDILGTEKMLSIIKPAFLAHSIYTSYPGSYLYDWIKENNYWVGEDENDPKNHYSMHRFPFERKIKGIDYDRIFRLQGEYNAKYKGELRQYVKKYKVDMPVSIVEDKNFEIAKNKTENPLASVILVTYKRPELLKKAIESILNQKYKNWELIILDYTEEENWNVNQSLYDSCSGNSRIKWVGHKKDINNIAYIWNEGLDLMKGEFWCTLDDDNTKYPEYLEKTVNFLQSHPEKDAVVVAMEHTGETKGVHFLKPANWADLKAGNKIDSGQVVYRKSIIEKIGNFDERLVSYDDWDYMLRVFSLNNYSGSAFGWLDSTPLCSYHWHRDKRMYDEKIKTTYLTTETIVKEKVIKNNMRIKVFEPGGNGRTQSQMQLSTNIIEALKSLSFVELTNDDPDVIILTGTLYNMSLEDLRILKSQNPQAQIVALLCEDPQALHVNIQYEPYIDWMVTNDINAYNHYIDKISDPNKKKQVLHWNNLSISNKLLEFIKGYNPKKEYDICFVGYAYESRVNFMQKLIPFFHSNKIALIGNKWKENYSKIGINAHTEIYDTLDEIETAKIAMKSKIIIIKHRDKTDIGGFPIVKPESINRGYIEAAYRAVLMMDNDRSFHSFDNGSIIRYVDAESCARQIQSILKSYENMKPSIEKAYIKAIESFTMRERLLKVLNCVRSPRYNKKIE